MDKICIEKLYEDNTPCKNGFEVQISISSNDSAIYAAINQLMYFDKVFINDIDVAPSKAQKFNNRKIKNCGLYSICSIYDPGKSTIIRYGNVIYSISTKNFINLLDPNIELNGIAINFDIGELDINPNRESLLANDRTLNAFSKRLNALYKHLVDNYCLDANGNLKFDSISSFINAQNGFRFNVQHAQIDDIEYKFNIKLKSSYLPLYTTKMYVNDIEINKGFADYFNQQKRININDAIVGVLKYSQFTKNYSYTYINLSLYDLNSLLDNENTMFAGQQLSIYDRKYIRNTFSYACHSIVFFNKDKLYAILNDAITNNPSDAPTLKTIKALLQKADIKSIKAPDEFINSTKLEEKARRQKVNKQSIANIEYYIFYQFHHMSTYGNMIYQDRYRLSDLTRIKHTFIYGEKDDPLVIDVINSPLYDILCQSKCQFILCAKKYLKLLEPLPNALNIFDFLYKPNGYMRYCARKYYKTIPSEWWNTYNMIAKIEKLDNPFLMCYSRYNDNVTEFLNRDDSNFIIQKMKYLYPISNTIIQQLQNILSIVSIKELTRSHDEIRLAITMYCLHKLKMIQLSFMEISKIKLYLQNNLSTLNITLYENFSN